MPFSGGVRLRVVTLMVLGAPEQRAAYHHFRIRGAPPAIGLINDHKLRALAVTGPQRSPLLPDLPTVAEAGPLPGYEAVLHYGIVAPAGTPQPVIAKLAAAMKDALAEPDVRARIAQDGAEVQSMTPREYAADIDREETKWSKVVKLSGAKVE